MNQAHDTWISSKHGPILGDIDSCMACHAEEGMLGYIKAKLEGVRSVYYHITGQITGRYLEVARGTKPVYCTKSGCHSLDNLDSGLKINVNHKSHAQKGFNCVSCHDRIAHGWDEGLRSTPNMQETCFNCHNNETASHDDCGMCHIYQENMLRGTEGLGVRGVPSPHSDDLSCRDCHTHACSPDLKNCTNCHDRDIVDEKASLQAEISMEIERLRGTLRQLERIVERYDESYESRENPGAEILFRKELGLYADTRKNYEFILKDLSRGFHNFEYVRSLLEVSTEKANKAIALFSTSDHSIGQLK